MKVIKFYVFILLKLYRLSHTALGAPLLYADDYWALGVYI